MNRHTTLLSALTLALATVTTVHAQTQYSGIGFYMNSPAPSVAVPRYNAFVSATKQEPNVTAIFTDYRMPIWSAVPTDPQWSTNARWAASKLASLTSATYLNRLDASGHPAIIPIVSVGLT